MTGLQNESKGPREPAVENEAMVNVEMLDIRGLRLLGKIDVSEEVL